MSDTDRKFIVKESKIHGKGLFSGQHIQAGEKIGMIEGDPAASDGIYVLWVSDSDGIEVRNDFRYINHSKQPNVIFYDDLEVFTLRDIGPDEELTHNYGEDW